MVWLPVIPQKVLNVSPTADQPMETKIMRLLTKAAFAALLLGSTVIAAPAFADDRPAARPGLHRADSEGGQNNGAVRRADSEGGQNNGAVRQADSEGGQNNGGPSC